VTAKVPRFGMPPRFRWMRFVLPAVLVAGAVAGPRQSPAAEQERPVVASVTMGARFFSEDLGLQTALSYGARVDMSFSSRVGMIFDFVDAQPLLSYGYESATVPALRALLRVNALEGKYRPYALLGPGGLLLQYPKGFTTGAATVTFGAGLEGRFGPKARVFVEGTLDLFWVEDVVYYFPGYPPIQVHPRESEDTGTICAGVGLEF
jgi:hypothetical protein